MTFHPSVLEAIGNTPLIKLKGASEATGCTILGKAEFLNPGQSVKDRAALYIIRDAEKKGLLQARRRHRRGHGRQYRHRPDLVAKALGYRTVIVIPETQSQEKKDALQLLGAELVEVPAVPYKNPNNYVKVSGRLAEQLAKTEPNGAIWANQFDNVANRQAHIETTAPEIWNDTDGKVDGFICSVGSGGTLAGVAAGLQGLQQGHQDRHCRSRGRRALRILRERRVEVRRLLDHRRHRPGPHHRQPRRFHARFRLPGHRMPKRCPTSSTSSSMKAFAWAARRRSTSPAPCASPGISAPAIRS